MFLKIGHWNKCFARSMSKWNLASFKAMLLIKYIEMIIGYAFVFYDRSFSPLFILIATQNQKLQMVLRF